jgi:Fe-S-cluster-containing hydrogenase component 2
MGIPNAVNSHYYAQINPDDCDACGICAEERCQVNAIEKGKDSYKIIREKCIGYGLCVSSCPTEAIQLFHKQPDELVFPVKDEEAWFDERARQRGVDYKMLSKSGQSFSIKPCLLFLSHLKSPPKWA